MSSYFATISSLVTVYSVSSYIMVVRWQQVMPFWLSLPMAGEGLLQFTEESRIKLFSSLVYWFCKNPSMAASSKPLQRGSGGCCIFIHQNHAAGGGKRWKFVCLCLASQNLSEQDFPVPAGMELAVQLLTHQGLGSNEKLPPRRFPKVGIELKFCRASTQPPRPPPKHHHHGVPFAPPRALIQWFAPFQNVDNHPKVLAEDD